MTPARYEQGKHPQNYTHQRTHKRLAPSTHWQLHSTHKPNNEHFWLEKSKITAKWTRLH